MHLLGLQILSTPAPYDHGRRRHEGQSPCNRRENGYGIAGPDDASVRPAGRERGGAVRLGAARRRPAHDSPQRGLTARGATSFGGIDVVLKRFRCLR